MNLFITPAMGLYHYRSSTKIALALDNPRMLICHWTKKKKKKKKTNHPKAKSHLPEKRRGDKVQHLIQWARYNKIFYLGPLYLNIKLILLSIISKTILEFYGQLIGLLWHINTSVLFNATLCLYIYIYIYSAIRRKLKPCYVVIINLFCQRILFYSSSCQRTFSMLDLRL